MEIAEVLDYSLPCLNAQKSIKDMQAAMLSKDYDAAVNHATNVVVEMRLVLAAIRHEKETAR